MSNFRIISISLDAELLNDINFMFAKRTQGQDPKNSYGKIFYELLRTIVPHSKEQYTDKGLEIHGNGVSESDQDNH